MLIGDEEDCLEMERIVKENEGEKLNSRMFFAQKTTLKKRKEDVKKMKEEKDIKEELIR